MARKIYRAALFYLLLLTIDGKKTRRIKTTQPEDQDSSPQPSVVSYSTFGFNDVGSYDGFVPSSPDYATYLSSNVNHQDSTPPRLYAPAFPSASETGFGNIGAQQDGQAFSSGDDNSAQPSVLQYNSAPYFNPDNDQSQNGSPEEKYRRIVDEESNSPVYGTKLGGKNKHKLLSQFNDTAVFDVYSNGDSNPSETISRYPHYKETETTHEAKPVSYGESASSHQNIYNYAPTYTPTEADEVKPSSNNTYSFNFPKVIDFTKYKQYYPTEVENKFPTATFQPVTNRPKEVKHSNNFDSHMSNNYDSHNNDNYDSHGISNNYGSHSNNNYDLHSNNKNYESHSSLNYPPQAFKNTYEVKEEDQESDIPKPAYTHHSYSNNFVSFTSPKSSLKDTKPDFDYKDKMKHTPPWASSGHNSSIKNWRSPVKGYEYSTDFSNMSFKYDTSVPEKEKHSRRKPFNSHTDELTPASSNVVDLPDYKFPELDYSSFKKIPGVKAHYDDDYSSLQSKYKDLFKSDDYINQFKNLYSGNAPSTSSLWGNVYKGPDFTSLPPPPPPPISSHFGDEITNDVVHIPKSKQKTKFSHNKYSDTKPSEWSFQNKYRPHKTSKPNDWTKEVSLTRFKSEEDLLGLRTHDTSHPSYLPAYRPFNDVSDEFDYKKLVEKWRQSYLKSKYKDSFRDFETYASDAKPIHVPIPKPYAIEVPRPVIVPVPEPYPVRVPIPRPVAVPVVRELKVQIEKPVPYPVYKKVPYPVEKYVPVPVEKQVPVPVMKPYPVAVPHIRPVFHHTRPHAELDEAGTDEDDDYLPRPEGYRTSKKVPYSKRPKSPRYRPRRPQRPTYHERNRRQWPVRRPTRRPSEFQPSPFRSHYDDDEYERSDYYLHCKRTGHC